MFDLLDEYCTRRVETTTAIVWYFDNANEFLIYHKPIQTLGVYKYDQPRIVD